MRLRWFKKIARAILNLLPLIAFTLIPLNASALQHHLKSVPYFANTVPATYTYNSDTGFYQPNWNDPSTVTYVGGNFLLSWKGDAYNSAYDDLNFKRNYSLYSPLFNSTSNKCEYNSPLNSIFNWNEDSVYLRGVFDTYPQEWTSWDNYSKCHHKKPFGDSGQPQFDSTTIPSGTIACSKENGANCPGLWSTRNYVQSKLTPYWYTSDGFYVLSSPLSSNGLTYSYTFSFDDMFNNYIPTFSTLNLPLTPNDYFFYTPSELYAGRSIEVKGGFDFSGSFAWHNDVQTNGSKFEVHLSGTTYDGENDPVVVDKYYQCNVALRQYQNTADSTMHYSLSYSCPFELEDDYMNISLTLHLAGENNGDGYLWITDSPWRWAASLLITDNDTTPGRDFGDDLRDGEDTIGSDEWFQDNNDHSSEPDFFESLVNLFSWNFINPFAPLFQMFSDNNSCAEIPTIAGMIHSEDATVCPWFDSTTRNIVTPVLGIASIMLVFGFAVRWLGSSSGNMFEDSSNETISNINHSGFRRYKK